MPDDARVGHTERAGEAGGCELFVPTPGDEMRSICRKLLEMMVLNGAKRLRGEPTGDGEQHD